MTIIHVDKYGCLTQSSGSMRTLCILATVALAAVRNEFLILDTDRGEQFLVDTGKSENQDTNHAILTVPYSAPQSSRTTRGQNFAKHAQEWDKNSKNYRSDVIHKITHSNPTPIQSYTLPTLHSSNPTSRDLGQ